MSTSWNRASPKMPVSDAAKGKPGGDSEEELPDAAMASGGAAR